MAALACRPGIQQDGKPSRPTRGPFRDSDVDRILGHAYALCHRADAQTSIRGGCPLWTLPLTLLTFVLRDAPALAQSPKFITGMRAVSGFGTHPIVPPVDAVIYSSQARFDATTEVLSAQASCPELAFAFYVLVPFSCPCPIHPRACTTNYGLCRLPWAI